MLLWRQTKEEAQVPREFRRISIRQIRKNPNQPRKLFDAQALQELADSIGKYGVITPLTVRQTEEGYELVAGERRLRAASMAGLSTVPCYIVQADDRESSLMALLENLQRKDLDCFEEAASLRRLCQEYHMTQKEAAERVGKSRPAVANALRLLTLSEPVLEKLKNGELTAGHARAILQLKTEKKQLEAAQKIAALGLSVRQAELLCKNMSQEAPKKKEIILEVDYVAECERNLSKALGRGVKIVNGKRKGRFELEFYGQDDLQNLLDALMNLKK